MDSVKAIIARLADGRTLSRDEAETVFEAMLSGQTGAAQTAALLMALRVRGETVDELTGAVAAMRRNMLRVGAPLGAIDIVGTGGDGHNTFNVSTLAAIIEAACGVPVAKHGNRSASSSSGASDVLGALGVAVGLDATMVEHCLARAGLAFMAAPSHHVAMRHVASVRADLGTRTIFNLVGPLANPAGVKRLLVGVFAPGWQEPFARVLGTLGAERAWVVHGSDGLDEITTAGPTDVVEWHGGTLRAFTVRPEHFGLARVTLAALKGGRATDNAAALRRVLAGERGPYRDIASLNAAAALVIADRAPDLGAGLELAAAALDDGSAAAKLDDLVRASHDAKPLAAGTHEHAAAG